MPQLLFGVDSDQYAQREAEARRNRLRNEREDNRQERQEARNNRQQANLNRLNQQANEQAEAARYRQLNRQRQAAERRERILNQRIQARASRQGDWLRRSQRGLELRREREARGEVNELSLDAQGNHLRNGQGEGRRIENINGDEVRPTGSENTTNYSFGLNDLSRGVTKVSQEEIARRISSDPSVVNAGKTVSRWDLQTSIDKSIVDHKMSTPIESMSTEELDLFHYQKMQAESSGNNLSKARSDYKTTLEETTQRVDQQVASENLKNSVKAKLNEAGKGILVAAGVQYGISLISTGVNIFRGKNKNYNAAKTKKEKVKTFFKQAYKDAPPVKNVAKSSIATTLGSMATGAVGGFFSTLLTGDPTVGATIGQTFGGVVGGELAADKKEIDPVEITVKGTCGLAGQTLIPIPIVGGIIGSAVGQVGYNVYNNVDQVIEKTARYAGYLGNVLNIFNPPPSVL